ncbi:MAG: sorbosone dehydrogenase family protein [Haloarculaceae archaeon]
MTDDPLTRRDALQAGGLLLAGAVAGCQTADDGESPTGTDASDGGPTGKAITTTGGTTTARANGTPPSETPGGGAGTDTPTTDRTRETAGENTSTAGDDGTVTATRVASGFVSPLGLEIPQRGRRFVVDQAGKVYLQDSAGVHSDPFLDVTDRMVDVGGYSERGLLGLAFHPEFDENGRFFVRYSAPAREGTPGGYSHTFVLSEFHADPGARTADPDSERTVLEIPEPQSNHNAGAVAFGPDGYLYVATGDGGGANDVGNGHVADWYDGNDGGNGQDVTENLLGSVLRIDVDADSDADGGPGSPTRRGENAREYAVPSDNPLVGTEGLDEHFAWGFRNPWRLSFGPDGRLFVGDVGQNRWEEVSVVERGGNYGWNVKEGTHCFGTDGCPAESPRGRPLRDPVIEYPHGGDPVSGIAVVGGYLYDGEDMPAFRGQYLFADWRARGRLFAARERDDGRWPARVVSVESDAQFGPNVLSFGRNPDGELFVCTTAAGGVSGNTGAVFRLGG